MSKDLFFDDQHPTEHKMNADMAYNEGQAYQDQKYAEFQEAMSHYPGVSEIAPATLLHITKQNVAEFHQQTRAMILEGGVGMFEYLETIKFFCKLNEEIFGDDKKPGDKEFKQAVMDEISKHGKDHTTARGVKFELAETGTKYDYSNNPEWVAIDAELKAIQERKKELEDKLKKIPAGFALVDESTGETLIGPAKTSKSSFKIILAK